MEREPRQQPRLGLALAGGVIEGGFYEVGVLCALEEAIEGLEFARMDAYVGVSAGAILCSVLANGVSPRTLSRAILSQAEPALNLNPNTLFSPALREYGRRVGAAPAALARWLRTHAARPFDVSLAGALVELGGLLPVGIFDSTPMERYLAHALSVGGRTNDFRGLDTTLRIVAVKLDTAELVVFGDEATEHVPISKAVQASTALPGLYCPVEIDGEWYIDGVARRTLHASRVLDERVGMLFCVNPIVPVDMRADRDKGDHHGFGRGHSLVDFGLPAVLSQTFRTMIQSRMNTAFRSYEHTHPGTDILLIEPEMTDHRMFFSNIFSFHTRQEVCEHAYASTRRFLRANREVVEAKLARHGLRLRHEVLDDRARTLFPAPPPARRGTLGAALGEVRETIGRLEAALERLGRAA